MLELSQGFEQIYRPQGIDLEVFLRIAHTGGWSVFKRRMFAGEVLHNQLNGEPLQVIIRRRIAGVVAERQIDRVPCRLDIAGL